ncbi:hypothetical protein OROMI_013713 [Orobanche minor]
MESLSRVSKPPHRRKHSTTNSFSLKNPYDDVFISNGGKTELLEAHEYAEIFSGSSSIPVIDLSGLDERVASGDCRSSKLDYSNIFGGFRNDDVAVPYEELFNGPAKKSKLRNSTQEACSLHPSGSPKRSSDEAPDQSVNGLKKQFNVSFNRTSQKNTDASNGKIHIAQLKAVPGFTCFVDGTPGQKKTEDSRTVTSAIPGFTYFVNGTPGQKKTEDSRTVTSLKREVSRTWSFSAEVETVKDKGDLSHEKSHIPNKSHNVNDGNLKSNLSKVPPLSSFPSNISGGKDPRQSRATYFVPKTDTSEESGGEFPPPYFGEDFEVNSVAAASAAALKKAIDQAQESIRLAKIIMDRKKEGYQNGSKPKSKGRRKVLDKEGKIGYDSYGSKKNNIKEKYEELDPGVTISNGIDEFTRSLSHGDTFINAAKIEVERVWENVEAAKEHVTVFCGSRKLFSSNGSPRELVHIDEKVELEKTGENVETDKADFPLLVANEWKNANPASVKVGSNNSLLPSVSMLESHPQRLETSEDNLEESEVTVYQTKEPEVVAELVGRALNTSQMMQDLERNVEETEQCQATSEHAEGPEKKAERILDASQTTRGQEKVSGEAGKSLGITQEDEVSEEEKNDIDDKGKQEPKEMFNVDHFTVLRSELDNFINETCNLVNETPMQVETERKSELVSARKENGLIGETCDNEAHLWFESEEHLKEVLEDEIYETERVASPEIGEVRKSINELEIDNENKNHAHDGDEPKFRAENEHNKIEERHMSTSEMGAKNSTYESEVLNSAVFCDSEEETNYTLEGAGRIEENHSDCRYEEDHYEEHIDEAVNANSSSASTIFTGAQDNDTSPISETQEACNVGLDNESEEYQRAISETQEACNVGLDNGSEEYQRYVKNCIENNTVSEVNEPFSAVDKDKNPGHWFHLEDDNEMSGTETIRRIASDEVLPESKLHDAFNSLSSDGKMENVRVGDPEEELPEDEDASSTTSSKIHDVNQEYMANNIEQNLPQVHASDIGTSEVDIADVSQLPEQTSESDEESVSTSSNENINGFSAHESEEFAENLSDMAPNNEQLQDDPELVSNERVFSKEQSEPKETKKPMETKRAVERRLNTGNNKENLIGDTPMEEKDTRGDPQNSDKNDYQQRIEAIKRGREREKDRIVVERAIREARERAFAEARERAERAAVERASSEARERAERAAVERASSEARQRAMAEALEKLHLKPPVDKASTEAKLKAERAAVERATVEARERALEKALSQKTTYTQGKTTDSGGSSRNNGLKHSFSSSDLENGTESAQRRKARLERHQRIMERAAKALAEKNMRDLLVQKEQAERNRLAETLDADIKRWASGKEKNLRALLSTLQYILGSDSGWQPIPLTEIITTAAVKKAYRKATLYVHPDKLQQRGASIRQKYLCEKVFDLLKAAWNWFNSDER